jgi:hypothetical protein
VIESKSAIGATRGLDLFLSRLAHGPRGSANLDQLQLCLRSRSWVPAFLANRNPQNIPCVIAM